MKHVRQAWFSIPFACELNKAATENGSTSGLDASQLRQDSTQIVQAIIDNEADVQVARLMHDDVDRIVNRQAVVLLFIHMSKEYTKSPSLRDSFLQIVVHKLLGLSKVDSDLIPQHLVPLAKLLAAALTHPATRPESYQMIRQLITEIWKLYLRDVVQARSPPPTLVMSPIRGISKEINEVNRFLADPTRVRYELRANKNERESMESDFRMAHGEAVLCETVRTGSPHRLVITKRPDFPYKREVHVWNAGASEATRLLLQCPQLVENKILDPSFFTVLPEESMRFVLKPWFKPSAALGYQVQAPQSNNASIALNHRIASNAVLAKRKASDDIVDLTGA